MTADDEEDGKGGKDEKKKETKEEIKAEEKEAEKETEDEKEVKSDEEGEKSEESVEVLDIIAEEMDAMKNGVYGRPHMRLDIPYIPDIFNMELEDPPMVNEVDAADDEAEEEDRSCSSDPDTSDEYWFEVLPVCKFLPRRGRMQF